MTPFSLVAFSIDSLSKSHNNAEPKLNKDIIVNSNFTDDKVILVQKNLSIKDVELCGSNMYVALSDGSIAHFTLESAEIKEETKPLLIKAALIQREYVLQKDVEYFQLYAIPSENSIIAHLESSVYFLNLQELKSSLSSIKNVSCIGIDSVIHSPIQFSIGERKSITIYSLDSSSKLKSEKKILTEEYIKKICKSGFYICYANSKSFNLFNLKSDDAIPLFPHELSNSSSIVPLIENEFLLVTVSAQGFGMGVFVNKRGEPIRGTLQWPIAPISVAYQNPWIISLLRNSSVQIHDITTLSLIQSISIPSLSPPLYLKVTKFPFSLNGDGHGISLIIGTLSEILGLRSIPWDEQLRELLEKNEVNEAISLLERLKVTDLQEKRQEFYYNRAGFLLLESGQFPKAFMFFKKGQLKPNLILPFFLDDFIFPTDDNLTEYLPEIGFMQKLFLNPDARTEAYESLLDYLIFIKTWKIHLDLKQDVDDALLISFTKRNDERLKSLLLSDHYCTLNRCEKYLRKDNRYYMLSLLYKHYGNHEETLVLWTLIASGELNDPDFEGILVVIDYLKSITKKDVIFRFGTWVISRDPIRGVQIFLNRKDDIFEFNEILLFLDSYYKAKTEYLQQIFKSDKSKRPQIGNLLAPIYLDDVLQFSNFPLERELDDMYQMKMKKSSSFLEFLRKKKDPFSVARLRFFDFIQSEYPYLDRNCINVLQSKLDGIRGFFLEKAAILICQKHVKAAIKVIALDLKDPIWSLDFSYDMGKTLLPKSFIYLQYLTKIYISSNEEEALMNLIAKFPNAICIDHLLNDLPSTWHIRAISGILVDFERKIRQKIFELKLYIFLAKTKYLKTRKQFLDFQSRKQPILITYTSCCHACKKNFADSNIIIRSRGLLHHAKCK